MRPVYIVAANEYQRGNLWHLHSCDLALEVCKPLLSHPLDALFVAAPSSARLDGQANYAAVLADRLSLPQSCLAQEFDNGDIAGATALSAAVAFISAGIIDTALLLGIAKVSDWEDKKRYGLADELLDPHSERQLGLDYLSLSGLLAANYLEENELSAEIFHHLVAKNHVNACRGNASYLSYPALPEELARDIKTAFPLGRSDIAPLVDGAVALILTAGKQARQISTQPVRLASMGTGLDVTALADRADISSFIAVEQAYKAAYTGDIKDFFLLEIQNSSSVTEILASAAIGLIDGRTVKNFYKEGGGSSKAVPVVNAQGGQQGLGNLFGIAALEHAVTAWRQLRHEAGDYQLRAAEKEKARVLSVTLAGLGTQSYCFVYEKVSKITE